MPPESTNIHVTLGDKELSWTNYTGSYPEATHHTAIGDWWMIYSVISNVSNFFVLKIHYEHPLEMVNGSYQFLYDLNISPYLSAQSSNSTAYFTIRMETNATNLKVYTTETDTEWNPVNYTISKDGSKEIIAFQMHSEYSKPLLGDLVITFSKVDQVPEFPSWIILLIVTAMMMVSAGLLIYFKKHKLKAV
jgi:hypothetical protein